jgi:hypothetical protein
MGTVARGAWPCRNVIVPVGVPEEPEVTTAVNVTCCPAIDGLSDELTVVVVGAVGTTTFCVTDDEVLAREFESPPYVAVTTWGPVPRFVSVSVAVPPTATAAVPIVFGPFLNVTWPLTAPPYCPVTVATKFTGWPGLEGFGDEVSVVEVVAVATDSLRLPALPLKLESPP